ncbi:MAG: hypothetical protein GTN38_03230 [Candidatus Aenigmarchaeota archaeon]|nr:hypothetical protein [Candidatus Aenigmarchaeota archaeon]NIP40674.1 hypothetical protein [Candidatus Aenigmarchaeota archaeon]NIQ18480.1 hypothetical protein [Candidatus Aenigmarchaeota archaeon]NIS73379.1 hypothetical protein [Candidatus Aenigmarchaeota archaeon]
MGYKSFVEEHLNAIKLDLKEALSEAFYRTLRNNEFTNQFFELAEKMSSNREPLLTRIYRSFEKQAKRLMEEVNSNGKEIVKKGYV